MKGEKSSSKREALISSGRKLFWKYGFIRVSIDEICRDAEVSKMTFYRSFKNKTDLAKVIFSEMVKDGIEKFNEIIYADATPAEKLKRILILKLDGTNDISEEFLNDFYNSSDTELPGFVAEITRKSWEEIIKSFHYAQEQGWFRKDFKPEFLFFVARKMGPMLSDKELLKFYNNPQDLIMEFANFFTYGISPHE